ncbi:TetR/AcrR family transcriptional regulator [Actinoplanes sp. NPDC051861]|uniref:TetR/AcrR family transcriptional regulator n=1 Tax=Actinoplanes sp. NPDC051861 TaxID=3155170 RepID=UPI00343EF91E
MPRVSPEYLAGRRAEILSAAARLFAANGFHATSMADIITESQLSAGAVYRYFRSKEELIGSVADLALSTADEVFGKLLAGGATPSPADAVVTMITSVSERLMKDSETGVDISRIAVQVWAEALRNPEVSARADHTLRRLRAHCAEVARRWQAAGNLPEAVNPEDVGGAMLSLAQGYVLQHLLLKDFNPEAYAAGVRALLTAG